jgi:hypothetical protein
MRLTVLRTMLTAYACNVTIRGRAPCALRIYVTLALTGASRVVKAKTLAAYHASAHIVWVEVTLTGIADFAGTGRDRRRSTVHSVSSQLFLIAGRILPHGGRGLQHYIVYYE